MKLQHTSGAVIEDERLVETERSFNFYDPTCMLMANYLKSDWHRVPEERWEKVILEVEENSTSAYLRLPNHDRSRIGMVGLPRLPKLRYRIVDGNLCVERRVEGA